MSDNLVLAALGRLEAGQTAMDARLTSLDTRLTSMDTRLTSMDTRLTALETGLTSLETGLTSLQAGQTALETRLTSLQGSHKDLQRHFAGLQAGLQELREETTGERPDSLRVVLMGRLDRLQDSLTDIRNDIAVNYGASDAVRRANDSTRDELRLLTEQVSIMYRQIKNLEQKVRDITGDP